MKTALSASIGRLMACLVLATLLSGCGSIAIVRPAGQNGQRPVVPSPVTIEAKWNRTSNLQFLIDGQDRTAEFSPSGSSVTQAVDLAPGPHKLEVWGDVDCFYCTGGVNHQGTVREFDVTPPGAADFSLTAPSSVTVQRGRQGTFPVTVNRNAQMHDAVSLAAPNPPPGITMNFQPNPVPQDQQSSTATVGVDSTLAIGSQSLAIRGEGGGLSRPASTTLQVAYADPAVAQAGADCGCNSSGDWVAPAPLQTGATSPDGSFTLTASQSANSVTLTLSRANPACTMSFGPFNLSNPIQWGFSPHGKYFVIIRYSSSTVYADFYGLATCNSLPSNFAIGAYQAPAAGPFAGWGFAPGSDDGRFVMAGVNSQGRPEVTLVNVPANRQQLVASPATEASWTFSPCGDIFGIKKVENTPQARLVFEFYRTRDFAFVAPTGDPTVNISNTYSDASLNANAQCHRLKRVRVSDGMTESESQWPCVLTNGAAAPCQ